MSTNKTGLFPLTTERTPAQPHSDELLPTVLLTFQYALIPCASLLGIGGNVTSIVILTRHGFRKCSNILLLYLAVSNIFLLIGINNFPVYIYMQSEAFPFSETENYICYILYQAISCSYYLGTFSSAVIPVLITGERILVIFWPFKARLILTPGRTTIVLACLYVVSGIIFIYQQILMFQFKQFVIQGVAIGVISQNAMYFDHVRSGLYELVDDIYNYLTGVVPMSLVAVGCVVMGLKISQITSRRRQLTNKQINATRRGTTKTTRTLLSICVLYLVCYGFSFSYLYIINAVSIENVVTNRVVAFRVSNLVSCFNCIGDFLFYINANSSLRRPTISNKTPRQAMT